MEIKMITSAVVMKSGAQIIETIPMKNGFMIPVIGSHIKVGTMKDSKEITKLIYDYTTGNLIIYIKD